ncbi:MAG: glucosamine inositolphosphorylceramide transferase family protein [Gemmatimonadaceae bacterium]
MPDAYSVAGTARLRFGVMCSGRGITRFAESCIRHLTRDGLAEPALLIIDPSQPRRSGWPAKLRRAVRLEGNLWHLQNKLFPAQGIEAYRTRPLDECFPRSIPRREVQPLLKGRWSQHFSDDDVAGIRAHQLDFILKFAFGIVRGAALETARYGVWSFHHGDEEHYRGGPPAFWEIYKGDPITGALFQRLTDRLDGGIVLKKCWVATDPRSHRANLQRVQAASAHLARLAALDIAHGRSDYFSGAPSKTTAPVYVAPNERQMLRFWFRLAANWVRYKVHNQRVDDWNVGLIAGTPQQWLDPHFVPNVQWSRYRVPGQMLADPFLVPAGAEPRILVEEFDWRSERGRISEIRRSSDGTLSEIAPAIDEDLHMSYPCCFAYDGGLYCIPETAQARQIRLYRWHDDSARWALEGVMIDDVAAVDATVFEAFGSWWLFAGGSANEPDSVGSRAGPWSLYVWNAPSPFGPWSAHPGNPVKTDVRSSRPAGTPFWHDGRLYRPAQNGAKSYGGGLALNRIDRLSMDDFSETTVRQILPSDLSSPYTDGIHTLNGFGPWTVIDAKRHTWPFTVLARRMSRRIRGSAQRPTFRLNKRYGKHG